MSPAAKSPRLTAPALKKRAESLGMSAAEWGKLWNRTKGDLDQIAQTLNGRERQIASRTEKAETGKLPIERTPEGWNALQDLDLRARLNKLGLCTVADIEQFLLEAYQTKGQTKGRTKEGVFEYLEALEEYRREQFSVEAVEDLAAAEEEHYQHDQAAAAQAHAAIVPADSHSAGVLIEVLNGMIQDAKLKIEASAQLKSDDVIVRAVDALAYAVGVIEGLHEWLSSLEARVEALERRVSA